ncbi:Ribosomal protein S3 [Enterobacterales bacterium 8AC]|nr:Ribosomal protein S3 [Enterobacterales bacterium 8AC]
MINHYMKESENTMKNISMLAAVALVALMLNGCVAPAQQAAPPKLASPCSIGDPMVQTTLYFGLNRPVGPTISAVEWQSFVDQQVTPRFKDGLSVFDAKGQWLGNDGKLARKNSKALMLIHTPGTEVEQKIEALRTHYKQQFVQDSVMRVDTPVCVAF